jgi:hypothetical protein
MLCVSRTKSVYIFWVHESGHIKILLLAYQPTVIQRYNYSAIYLILYCFSHLKDFYFDFLICTTGAIINNNNCIGTTCVYSIEIQDDIYITLYGIYYINHQHPHSDWRQVASLDSSYSLHHLNHKNRLHLENFDRISNPKQSTDTPGGGILYCFYLYKNDSKRTKRLRALLAKHYICLFLAFTVFWVVL